MNLISLPVVCKHHDFILLGFYVKKKNEKLQCLPMKHCPGPNPVDHMTIAITNYGPKKTQDFVLCAIPPPGLQSVS